MIYGAEFWSSSTGKLRFQLPNGSLAHAEDCKLAACVGMEDTGPQVSLSGSHIHPS